MVEVETELINALKTNLTGGVVKTFYQGEVTQPPRDYCPLLMLWITQSSIRAHDTASDIAVFTGKIRVIFSLPKYLKDTGVETVGGVRRLAAPYALKELIEARDVSNGTYAANSIMGILRSRSVIRGTTYNFNNDFSINYGTLAQPEFPMLYAEITFSVTTIPVRRLAT